MIESPVLKEFGDRMEAKARREDIEEAIQLRFCTLTDNARARLKGGRRCQVAGSLPLRNHMPKPGSIRRAADAGNDATFAELKEKRNRISRIISPAQNQPMDSRAAIVYADVLVHSLPPFGDALRDSHRPAPSHPLHCRPIFASGRSSAAQPQ